MATRCVEAHLCELPSEAFPRSVAVADRDGPFDVAFAAYALSEYEGYHEGARAAFLVASGMVLRTEHHIYSKRAVRNGRLFSLSNKICLNELNILSSFIILPIRDG